MTLIDIINQLKRKVGRDIVISRNFKEDLAQFISTVTIAPAVAIPTFALINYFLLNWTDFIIITSISIFFAALMPVVISILWIKNKKIEIDMPEKEDRVYPLLFTVISYFMGAVVFYAINAPPLTTVLMFCYFSNTTILFFINFFWKVSIHSMGAAGPTIALIYEFGYAGLIFAILVPVVMWSRVYLKRHTPSQVMMGAFLGFSLTAAQIYLFIGY